MKKFYSLLCAGMIFSLGSCRQEIKKGSDEPVQLKDVPTILAYESTIKQEISLTGKVIPDPDQTVTYTPLAGGVIVKTYFTLGDKVEKGDPLIDYRSAELSTLQAELQSLKNEYSVAERALQTVQGLFNDGISSEKELIEANNKLTAIQALLEKNKSDMSLYGLSYDKGIFRISAPVSGYITEKNASAGSSISSDGPPLFSIAGLDPIWVIANVYAGNLMAVNSGTEAEVQSIAYPDKVFPGNINHISQTFDPDDKTLKARIVLSNNNLELKPGMPVMVRIKNEAPEKITTVPATTLIFDDNKYHVVVYNNGEAEIREVSVAESNNKEAYISSGLDSGEAVVSKHQLLIYSGIKKN